MGFLPAGLGYFTVSTVSVQTYSEVASFIIENRSFEFMKILCVSLGCDKNLVDTEMMLGLLNRDGHTFTDDENEADIIVVNT